MADRTLTINHADGGSETYTLKTEDVLGVRSMSVDGETVTIDRTAPDLVRTIIADGQTITIDTTREGVRTLTVDGTEITIDRSEEATLQSFLQEFTGASAAYSLRDLAGSGNTTVVRVRRSSDNTEADFKASEVSSGTLVAWVGAGNNGFVETWYDQSGNGNDAVQLTAGSQPKIVDAGVLVSGGIDFDGVDDFFDITSGYTATNGAVFIVENLANTDPIQTFMGGGTGNAAGSGYLPLMQSGSTSTGTYIGATVTNDYLNGSVQSLSTRGDYFTAICNNTSQLFSAIGVTTSLSYTKLGKGGTSNWELDGTLAEVILYPSDQSANRAAIETNINNQYDIY